MSLAVALVVFVASAAALMGAGAMLATAGDELAEKTGLGGLFVGALIVGLATSLPEIATDVTAVVAGAPDLAVADLFGSSMANMAILAIIDLHHRGGVWPAVELGHARVAAVAIMLTSLAVLGTLVPPRITLGWVGPETVLIAVLYVAAMAWLRRSPLAGAHSVARWRRWRSRRITRPRGWPFPVVRLWNGPSGVRRGTPQWFVS